jgi:Tfp pilus assembly protein PilF
MSLKIKIILLVVTFITTGCVKPNESDNIKSSANSEKTKVSKQTDEVQKLSPEKQKRLIHIVKKGDNSSIDMWLDPFEDEIEIDYKFSQPVGGTYSDYEVEENKNQKSTNTDQKSKTSKNLNNNKRLETYMLIYEEARKEAHRKKYVNALEKVNQAVAIMPNVAQAYSLRGSIYYKLKDYGNALKSWKKALAINPNLTNVRKSIEKIKNLK